MITTQINPRETRGKLYLTPFDSMGRTLLSDIIENASKWVYITSESFTDESFCKFLVNNLN